MSKEQTEVEMYQEMACVLSEEYTDENELWEHMQIPALEYFCPADNDSINNLFGLFGDVMSSSTREQLEKIEREGI